MDAQDSSSNHDASRSSWVATILVATTKISARWPVFSLFVAIAVSVGAGFYAQKNLKVKTERGDLISSSAPYQKTWLAFNREFPDVNDDVVIVVESESRDKIIEVIEQIGPILERQQEFFRNVLYRMDWSALQAKGLQFLSDDELRGLFQAAGQMQQRAAVPQASFQQQVDELVGGWKRSGSLPPAQRRMLELQTVAIVERLDSASGQSDSAITRTSGQSGEMPMDRFAPILQKLAAMQGSAEAAPIQYLLNSRGTMGFVQVQPIVPPNDFRGPVAAVDRLRALVKQLNKQHPQVQVSLTGIPVLECDEMISSERSMTLASVLSFGGVFALLLIGYRSWKYSILATVILVIGTTWSFAAAALVIGHLNILSMAFAAMLFGLGIDFSIVWLSHYMGMREQGMPLQDSLIETSRGMGPGIVTASLTAAAAFFVARLTDFTGVAELGVITGWGILLCTVATFTVLPAILVLWDRNPTFRQASTPPSSEIGRVFHPVVTVVLFLGLLGGLVWQGKKVHYDVNLLNMQAPGLESVRIQQRIAEQSDRPLLYAVSLAKSQEDALVLKQKLEALPTVGRVEELASKLPPCHPARKKLLAELQQGVSSFRTAMAEDLSTKNAPAPGLDPARIGKSLDALYRYGMQSPDPVVSAAAAQLDLFLDRLAQTPFPQQMQWLARFDGTRANREVGQMLATADFTPASLDDVPKQFASRFVGQEGNWLLQVYPKHAIWDEVPLRRFINELRSVDPHVTGTPVLNLEASLQIRDSYFKSAGYALIAVLILLMWDFGTIHETLLGIFPALAGLSITFGILGLIGENLNPANLIVLPLILGIGVDGGVHIVHDYRSRSGPYRLSRSTVRAIMLTSTTSIAGFAALMVADHRGLYSLGLVLTVGCVGCLITALGPVPALLTLIRGNPTPTLEMEVSSLPTTTPSETLQSLRDHLEPLPLLRRS